MSLCEAFVSYLAIAFSMTLELYVFGLLRMFS